MTDDLVGRLEAWADNDAEYGHHARSADWLAAKARIEALEAENMRLGRALEAIAEHPGPNADDACWSRVEHARAALGKDSPHAD